MIILGLDIATVSGFCVWDTSKDLSSAHVWSHRLKGETHEVKAAELGPIISKTLKKHNPDLVAIEAPLKNIIQHQKTTQTLIGEQTSMAMNPASVILPNQLVGAAMGIVGAFDEALAKTGGQPWQIIPELTWRKAFLGYARKKGMTRKDYKRAAREVCDEKGVTVTNDDQADAVGVTFAARHSDRFRLLERQAA